MSIPCLSLDEAYEAMVASTGRTEEELYAATDEWIPTDSWD